MKNQIVRFIILVALAISFLVVLSPAYATPIAHLTLQSEPGDYIGQGGTYDITYTPDNSDFFFAWIRRTVGPAPGSPAGLEFVLDNGGPDDTFALLFFGTDQLGIPIQTGFYPDAERADFASLGHPGLDVAFQHRGSNTLTGAFTIIDVSFSPDPFASTGLKIETFSATFEQHSEGAVPALFGTFTYNASPIPEPSTVFLLGSGLIGLGALRKKFRKK